MPDLQDPWADYVNGGDGDVYDAAEKTWHAYARGQKSQRKGTMSLKGKTSAGTRR